MEPIEIFDWLLSQPWLRRESLETTSVERLHVSSEMLLSIGDEAFSLLWFLSVTSQLALSVRPHGIGYRPSTASDHATESHRRIALSLFKRSRSPICFRSFDAKVRDVENYKTFLRVPIFVRITAYLPR